MRNTALAALGLAAAGLIVVLVGLIFGTQSFPHPEILPSYYLETLVQIDGKERLESLLYFLALIIGALLIKFFGAPSVAPDTRSDRFGQTAYSALSAALFTVIYVALKPKSLSDIATTLTDPHIGSGLLGPSLYFLSPGTTPGLDFESHYGVGHAYLFSFFLGENFEQTTFWAAAFLLFTTLVFYVGLHALNTWLFGRRVLPLVVTAFIFASQFDGFSFSVPSNLPLRFLLVPLCLWLCSEAFGRQSALWSALAGACCALALIWQTDTGLLVSLAAVCVVGVRLKPAMICGFGLSLITVLLALLLLMLGPKALTVEFFVRISEPIRLYGAGFGGVRLVWTPGWSIFYQIIAPIIIIFTVGQFWQNAKSANARHALICALALFGYLSLFKWVNRSIDVLWWLNGWSAIIVIAYWADATLGKLRIVALAAVLVLLTMSFGERISPMYSRAPAVRWAQFFNAHPSVMSIALDRALKRDRESQTVRHPRVVAAEDGKFLKDNSAPTERLFVISSADWHYLIDAKRAPGSPWVPLHLLHSRRLLTRTEAQFAGAERIFVENGAMEIYEKWNSVVAGMLRNVLSSDCLKEEQKTERWTVYRRICG